MSNKQIATVGGGCFWCVEAVMQRLRGVEAVMPGYAGGKTVNPSYREVCGGRTGHAEVVQVTFDADEVSYKDLLIVFMTTHDPTTLNRQGADVGTQYRSIILPHDEAQQKIAEEVLIELKDTFDDPIVTEIKPLEDFYEAEEDHHNYYNQHREQGYCSFVIRPKVDKLKQQYKDRLKAEVV
ncbi:MAG: peptide-methionine (S)-S-oxide reductase MsrA [Ekhidna sp.]|nr:peptide-methionine (S)-S-oxide reductase MsrA [Ekhidna sp.]MBC6425052.1 peptide-methionine (S)-S-oxide reductase MsrA [Ekhidna sp.]